MKLKTLIIINYFISGLVGSSVVALMTWIILHENDFLNICSQVFATVLFYIGIVILFSYQVNYYISKKIEKIANQLDTIAENNSIFDKEHDYCNDFYPIRDSIDNLEKRFENSTSRLNQTNLNFSSMIRSLAHDIRTPMTIIQGYIEEIEDNLLSPEEYPKVLKIIRKEIDFVTELSAHSINYLYTCGSDYKGEIVAMKEFIDEELFPVIRPRKGIVMINEVEETCEMFMDRFELKQALLNLLHNSSKFTYFGYIKIYMKNECLIIEDSGHGIDKAHYETLFQPFVKNNKDVGCENFGLGLGLSISRNLLDKYNYKIDFDLGFDKGARVVISKQKCGSLEPENT